MVLLIVARQVLLVIAARVFVRAVRMDGSFDGGCSLPTQSSSRGSAPSLLVFAGRRGCEPRSAGASIAGPNARARQHSTDEPTTRDPDPTTHDPNATTCDPDATTRDPDATTRDPDATTRDPDVTTCDPEATTCDPDPTTCDPDATTRDPDATTRDPDTTTRS